MLSHFPGAFRSFKAHGQMADVQVIFFRLGVMRFSSSASHMHASIAGYFRGRRRAPSLLGLEPGVFCHWGKSCETCPKLSNIREPGVLSQKNLNPGLCHWRFANPGFCHTLTEPRVRTRGSVTRKLEPGVLSLEVCEPGVLEKPLIHTRRTTLR